MKVVGFDIDGTLVDHQNRLSVLYQTFLRGHGEKPLRRQRYWQLLRKGMANYEIFNRYHGGTSLYKSFIRYRDARIERPTFLKMDTPVPGIVRVLRQLSVRHKLVAVSLRANRRNTLSQLKKLGILRFFSAVACVNYRKQCGKERVMHLYRVNLFIGDSERDSRSARVCGVPFIGVLWGVRSRSFLTKERARIIIAKPGQLCGVVEDLLGQTTPPGTHFAEVC